MESNYTANIQLPNIQTLGDDLLELTNIQKLWTILKPFLCISFCIFFALNSWSVPFTLTVVVLMFVTYVSTSHDLVHGSLKLGTKANNLLLSITEMLVLRSGHAFKICHINHHRHFPKLEDIEGASAHKTLIETLLEGPFYIYRLYFWALKNARDKDKRWLYIEGVWFLLFLIIAILNYNSYPYLLLYFILTQLGSWLYPLFTVYIPHRIDHRHRIYQTKLIRGPLISFIFAHHNYHLEHHLYPMVPHQNWRKLAKRLSPYLKRYSLETITI
jgi:beta-carotene hydroxylase